jgi:hypothetical protein
MHQISKTSFCHKTLHVSGIFCDHHQELHTVHMAIGMFHFGTEFQPDSASKRSHNLHETYQLPCVQQITPDDGHRICPKHVEFYDKIKFWIFDASSWLFYTKLVTMHGHLNINTPIDICIAKSCFYIAVLTTTCFGHDIGHHQVVHSLILKQTIQYKCFSFLSTRSHANL